MTRSAQPQTAPQPVSVNQKCLVLSLCAFWCHHSVPRAVYMGFRRHILTYSVLAPHLLRTRSGVLKQVPTHLNPLPNYTNWFAARLMYMNSSTCKKNSAVTVFCSILSLWKCYCLFAVDFVDNTIILLLFLPFYSLLLSLIFFCYYSYCYYCCYYCCCCCQLFSFVWFGYLV